LIRGNSINISETNYRFLRGIGYTIENEEILSKCVEYELGKEDISVSNCISKIETKEEFGCEIEEELTFIAKHFYELDLSKLTTLSHETVEVIVSHNDLCLEDEESLLKFLSGLGSEYSNLYGYVECRYLSLSGIEEFLCEIDETAMDQRVWGSICRRLRCELSDRKRSEPRFYAEPRLYHYVAGHEFEGIINALTKECGGNVHDKGIVNITSSGDYKNRASQVADHGWNGYWSTQNTPNSWICFDFKEKNISLERYTLKSDGGGHYLVQWEIEGSNDGTTWTRVDRRNTQELRSSYIVKGFECSSENRSKFFRYIRLRQSGINAANCNHLMLCNIEFFGILK
jgi:hypothetical protein